MSDVLSADEVLRLDIDFDPDGDWAKAEESWAALARSHEQLRGERDGAFELAARKRDEAQAAARAGDAAAAALREAGRALMLARNGLDLGLGCARSLATGSDRPERIRDAEHHLREVRQAHADACEALSVFDRAAAAAAATDEERRA